MKWFILLVGLVVLCFVVALVLGLVGGGMGRATSSLSHEPLPDDEITDADFDELVFDVTARGYRMSEVDAVVDRLRRALREKDEEIAVLRGSSLARATGGTSADGAEPTGEQSVVEEGEQEDVEQTHVEQAGLEQAHVEQAGVQAPTNRASSDTP